jgi:hypothetical protein
MNTIRVKITPIGQAPWFASAAMTQKTPEACVRALNLKAKRMGLGCTYDFATEEQYQAYRRETSTRKA